MSQVKLDAGEMKDFLNHIISNNRQIQSQGLIPVAIEIQGEAGLGKTSVILQTAKEHNLDIVKLNLSQIEELGDIVGFPIRQFELCKDGVVGSAEPQYEFQLVEKNIGGRMVKVKEKVLVAGSSENTDADCIWVDENATVQYTQAGYKFTGKKRMSYCPPEWIADKTHGGILLLDDYSRADLRFLQAIMELIDRQEYISWKLPEDWHIILSSNPDDGNYLVNAIDDAQKTRFISIIMKWDEERWAEWAEKNKIDTRCINFVLMNPEIVTPKVNPRAITTFFNCISSIKNFEEELPMIQMIGEGSVGPEVATLFTTFINNRLDKLVTPKEMFLGADDATVGEKLLAAVTHNGDMNTYRADIASVLTTRLINYAVTYAEENPITDKHIARLVYLVKENILTDDLKYHLVKKVLNGNKQKFQKLLYNTTVQEYATK